MRSLAERQLIAEADAIRRAERKAVKRAKPKLDKGPERLPDYVSWLHEGLPCIACLIEGPAKHHGNRIEAAHIWLAEGAMRGVQNSDWTCIPLCSWHHRLDRDACDVAQRKFFDRLGVEPIGLCEALYAAFKAGRDGFWIIHDIAGRSLSDGRLRVKTGNSGMNNKGLNP